MRGLTFYSNGESTLMIVSFHEGCAHQTSLTLPLFIEVSVPSQKHMSGHAKGIAFAQSYDLHCILYLLKECGVIFVFQVII
jgi:hypothetical protein